MSPLIGQQLMRCMRKSVEHELIRRRFQRPQILSASFFASAKAKKSSTTNDLSSIIEPVKITANQVKGGANIGVDLTGKKLTRNEILKILMDFYQRPPIRKLSIENGMDNKLFEKTFVDFRTFCIESETLPTDLHITFVDILKQVGHLDDVFPFFLKHARRIFPHLVHLEELQKISDLRLPIHWYPEARAIKRKIIFHCGPTNSGKTYHALKRFLSSESGVYCGPLKLLAVEIFEKANNHGTCCDLITGEERRMARPDGERSPHYASTVEMVSTKDQCDVAVIDEIQMLRDPQRGWAWTRALLGIPAKELHLCGEEAALDVIRAILKPIDEVVEVKKYQRLTKLTIEENSLGSSLINVKPGDCIVCFSKNDLYSVSDKLERLNKRFAVIYGGLPPNTKLAQARKFNNPDDETNILVATDAIGMGLNLSINRVIFYSISKPVQNEKGQFNLENLPVYLALQIAGRAGRFKSEFNQGFVSTYRDEDLPVLKDILSQAVDPIEAAGLHPTADQIEMFSYYLPQSSLSNLIEIFISLCQVDTSNYFMCDFSTFKYLAGKLETVDLPLRTKYIFCCAPINLKMLFVVTMFTKFAKQFSRNEPVTLQILYEHVKWPPKVPKFIDALSHLEAVFDCLDLYLWLSYRFPDLFPDIEEARVRQKELDEIIHQGVSVITELIRNNPAQFLRDNRKRKPTPSEELFERDERLAPKIETSNMSHEAVIPKTALTTQLLSTGHLTQKMVRQLYKEWSNNLEEKDHHNVPGGSNLPKKK